MPLTSEQARLVEDHVRLADGVAWRNFRYGHSAVLGIEDMCAVARMFLCSAALEWDGTGSFAGFAGRRIRLRMIDWLRVNGPQNRRGHFRLADASFPYVEESADELYGEDGERSTESQMYDDDLPQFEGRLLSEMWVEHALAKLPPKERWLVEVCVIGDTSLREAADVLDVTESRVSQILKRALNRLRSDDAFIRAAAA